MLLIWDIHLGHHQGHDFMHEGAPAHKSKLVNRFLDDRDIPIWGWPCNSPYLNSIENA